MPELIDKQATLKKKCETCGYCESLEKAMQATHPDFVADKCNAYKFLEEQPTIDAEPVRRGRWIDWSMWNESRYQCSECNCEMKYKTNFCPNCGADMREGGADHGC